MSSTRTTEWIKATASNNANGCVEMRRNGDAIEVRDTKQHGAGPVLTFTPAEFSAWLDGATRGEFEHLI